jgi:hypothetical protein
MRSRWLFPIAILGAQIVKKFTRNRDPAAASGSRIATVIA